MCGDEVGDFQGPGVKNPPADARDMEFESLVQERFHIPRNN